MFIVAFRIYYQDIFDKGLLLTRKLAFGPSGKVPGMNWDALEGQSVSAQLVAPVMLLVSEIRLLIISEDKTVTSIRG
jgi:hypothetical protein